jgi:hypothetical protein
MASAEREINDQKRKLIDTSELVNDFWNRTFTDVFLTQKNNPRLMVIDHGSVASVYVLLRSAPIPQSVQVQWHVYSQPKNSYFVTGNVLHFRWGQSAGSFRQQQLSVTYVTDPKPAGKLRETLSERNGVPYADEEPLTPAYPISPVTRK